MVVLAGPAVRAPSDVASWFCRNEASTSLPGNPLRKRHQVASAEDARRLGGLVEGAMQAAGVLQDREVATSPAGLYGIRTIHGALVQGMPHYDWPCSACEGRADECVPCSTIWAACAEFTLVGPGGEVVRVPAGHMAVFRGDWTHQGGDHLSPGLRVHVFSRPRGSKLVWPQFVYPK